MANLGTQPTAGPMRQGKKQPSLGTTPLGGGKKKKQGQGAGANTGLDQGLYGDTPQGETAGNQDPTGYIRNILTQSGVLRGTGTSYDTWADMQLQKNILDKY